MIDFAAMKTAVVPILQSLTGLTAVALEDGIRPMPPAGQNAIALYSFFGVATIGGTDEASYARADDQEYGQGGDTSTFPEGGAEPPVIETITGRREITLRVKVDSIYQDANRDAHYYLERMRTRVQWSSIQAALRAAGLGFQDVAAATEVNETRDQHRASIAIFDLRCNVVATEADTENPIPTIERVDTGSAPR